MCYNACVVRYKGASCNLDGCEKPAKMRYLCVTHYHQARRHGKGYATVVTRLTPNSFRIEGDVAYMSLRNNKGETISEAIIDAEDVEKVKHIKWYRRPDGVRYVAGSVGKTKEYLHRFIMGCPRGMVVNHWNHNPLDCRKDNLVICTPSDNASYSRRTQGDNVLKSVQYRLDCTKPWRVRFNYRNTRIDLGGFNEPEEAGAAYDQVIMQLAGEYAYTNFDWLD